MWIVPAFAEQAVKGEMQDHAGILKGIAGDARSEGAMGQALRIAKQAKRFERMFQ
jgi:hypothetical protein